MRYWLSAIAEYVNERLSVMTAHTLLMLTQDDSQRAHQLYGRGADDLTPVALGDDPHAASGVWQECQQFRRGPVRWFELLREPRGCGLSRANSWHRA